MEDAFDCDQHRVETFGYGFLGFSQDTYCLQNKVKKSLCHFSLIFVFTPAEMHENLSFVC